VATQYITPAGDSWVKSRAYVYNPHNVSVNMMYEYLVNGTGSPLTNATKTIPPRTGAMTGVIPSRSGMKVTTSLPTTALHVSDTELKNPNGADTGGLRSDWGFTMLPTDSLTPQVLIGWG
jgi:hypothetical protein